MRLPVLVSDQYPIQKRRRYKCNFSQTLSWPSEQNRVHQDREVWLWQHGQSEVRQVYKPVSVWGGYKNSKSLQSILRSSGKVLLKISCCGRHKEQCLPDSLQQFP